MADGGADLSVVCPSCGAEVSPYVTECPYCGKRVQKRAPKIGSRQDPANRAKRRNRRSAKRSNLLGDRVRTARESLGPAELRPVVAPTLVAVSIVISALVRSGVLTGRRLVPLGDLSGEHWKLLTAPFVQGDVGYAFVALGAFAIFGSWAERVLGRFAPAIVWVVAGGGAAWLSLADHSIPATGALAAAFAVTVARAFATLEARRDGEDEDLVGIAVVLVVLLAMPPLSPEASWYAIAVGLACGVLTGSLAVIRQRSLRSG